MKTNFMTPQGADWVLNLTVKNDAGVVIDVTDWICAMTLKTDKSLLDDDPSVIEIVPTLSVTPTDGKITATVPALTTIGLSGTYYYDIKYKDGDGVVNYAANGVVTFSSIVTQRVPSA